MSVKEDIARIIEEVWTDETVGAAFQKSLEDTARYDLNHTVRSTLQRMVQQRLLTEIAKPYVEERVKDLEAKVKASIDARLDRMLEEIETALPTLVFESAKQYAQSWMADASSTLAKSIQSAVYRAFDTVKKQEQVVP